MANPYIQNDGTTSGAFLIENMYLDMNPHVVRQELTSENIYELHQELMSRNKRKGETTIQRFLLNMLRNKDSVLKSVYIGYNAHELNSFYWI
ncbi:MAG: hypothetical protein EBQ95_00150 [Gammaproteobacteria bacterium]|nr:hypothetical protein [Gammaproteobacteria bacterium]